ncbi:hypothetical protein B0H66DRAFT_494275 [Apodospora peruviana]|uniref:Uncharacterized protein n=1 Tax=Apodospora peruviana TaxID=516989 RepID=A0AAE0IAV9_9PEZI|nr:hypothetical protein B0H66DRAFT_494275 [Apodospora peruviana]
MGLNNPYGIPTGYPGGFQSAPVPAVAVPPPPPAPMPGYIPMPMPMPMGPAAPAPPAMGTTMGATPVTQRPYAYTSGLHGSGRAPQPYPSVNPNMPAANMTNSTGGVGCEPGYNYFFPPEHTKIHVLKCGRVPPWQQPPNVVIPFHACHVPVNTTVAELLQGFGATNPDKKKNKLSEVVQGGNGTWYRGIFIRADDKGMLSKTCKELGWDQSRTGHMGQKPVVFLYITKD